MKVFKHLNVLFMAQAAMIAAIYVVVTLLGASFAYGQVQVRLSEALTILPVFTPAAIPGVFLGCLISNILGGCILPDIIFGSLATPDRRGIYMEAAQQEQISCAPAAHHRKYARRTICTEVRLYDAVSHSAHDADCRGSGKSFPAEYSDCSFTRC